MKILILFLILPTISLAQKATIFIFDEFESGNIKGLSRMLFTNNFLRIDDGNTQNGYILFNNNLKKISSVSHENKTIFVIKEPKIDKKIDKKINFTETSQVDEKAPMIQGKKSTKITFYHGVKKCGGVNSINGLFDNQLKILQNYYQTLQLDAQVGLYKTPVEYQNGCYLNNFIYHLSDYYKNGFPLVTWREDGYIRILKNFNDNVEVQDNLFILPNYKSYSVN